MTKKLLSIAALTALLSTGASAFNTNTAGDLLDNSGKKATFTKSATNSGTVKRDSDFKGDALIYPAMNQKGNWGTEITVRNNMKFGVVAKAVVYSAVDSKEVKDFNIYLSANDVCRFEIKGNKITSTDDSIVVGERYINDAHVFASEDKPFSASLAENAGYVVIYGLGQDEDITIHGGNAKDKLFLSYRKDLRTARPNWDANGVNLTNGVYTGLPKVLNAPYTETNSSLNLTDVNDTALSGQVRLFNDEEGNERSLLLNATAVQNYTEENRTMLWAPREYASMADRNMNASAKYDWAKLKADADVYVKTGAYYTYNNAGSTPTVENKLILTQVYKRTLTQLNPTNTEFWTKLQCNEDKGKTTSFAFRATTNGNLWDEEENSLTETPGLPQLELFVSPATGQAADKPFGYCNELAEISSPEKDEEAFANKNGYIKFDFNLPAIVTQMSASTVGNTKRINWVNAVINID